MATATRQSVPSGGTKFSMDDIKTKGDNLPSRVVLHGVEGIGKTSFAARTPKPLFLMARGETGLETLIDAKQLGDVPHLPEIMDWADVLAALDFVLNEKHDFKTLALDTLNGFERLCHEHVCKTQYGNKWGKDGFGSYAQGYETSLAEWRMFLGKLDEIRAVRKMSIVCLAHTKVTPYKNPEGADYDRFSPDLHHKTWSLTHKWADIVMFANYYTVVDDSGTRPKGAGGRERTMYTCRTAAYDAKNRHGLPEEIDMGTNGEAAWGNFVNALKEARQSR